MCIILTFQQLPHPGSRHPIVSDIGDYSLLLAGSVFMHSLLDSLLVQSVYNRHIHSFWELLLGLHQYPTSSSLPRQIAPRSKKTIRPKYFRASSGSSDSNSLSLRQKSSDTRSTLDAEESKPAGGGLSEQKRVAFKSAWKQIKRVKLKHRAASSAGALCRRRAPVPSFGLPKTQKNYLPLEKIAVPAEFIGATFEDLFYSLYRDKYVVAVALSRSQSNASENFRFTNNIAQFERLPCLAILPAGSTILTVDDEVFILHPSNL